MYITPTVLAAHICRIYSSSTTFWDTTESRYVCNQRPLVALAVNFRNRLTPNWLAKVIRNYFSRVFLNESVVHKGHDTHLDRSLCDRITFAMILVLCSVGNITSLTAKITTRIGGKTDKLLCREDSTRVSICISSRSPVSHTCHHPS